MRKISSLILLALVLAVGASAQDAKGPSEDKGKDGKDAVTVPEPNNVPELILSGVGVGALMLILRRKMAHN